MTRSDAGRYSAKHAPGASPDETVATAIRRETAGRGELSCAQAERIAAALGVAIGEVGRTLDLLELRIGGCQLGLFGGDGPRGKAVRAAEEVTPALAAAIGERQVDGRLPCHAAWEIARALGIARIEVAAACEAARIRVKPCQLGAF